MKRLIIILFCLLSTSVWSQSNQKIQDAKKSESVFIKDSSKTPSDSIRLCSKSDTSKIDGPLMIYDGKIIPNGDLKDIDPSNIAELEVLKPDKNNFPDSLKEIGKYGVVIIKSYDFMAKRWYKSLNSILMSDELDEIINSSEFNYREYSVLLDNEYLKENFFLDDKLKELDTESIKVYFEKINDVQAGAKGYLYIETSNYDPWKSWDENYQLIDYSNLIEKEKYYADSIEQNPEIPQYFFRTGAYKVIGTYLGKKRSIKEDVLSSMKRVYKLTIGDPSELDELVGKEVLFELNGNKVWMPIQKQLESFLKDEIQKGSQVILYCFFLNEHNNDNTLYNTLLISEFRSE